MPGIAHEAGRIARLVAEIERIGSASVTANVVMTRFVMACFALLSAAAPAAAHTKADLDARLKLLMQRWPGDNDNDNRANR